MSAAPVSERQIEALLASVAAEFSGDYAPNAVVVSAQPSWDGPDQLSAEGVAFTVVPCVSVLAVRDALASADAPVVVLSPFGKDELGTDVCARIVKGRPLSSDRREAVAHLFGAAELDPRLIRNEALVDLLVASAPSGGYQRVTGRVLTEEHALRALAKEYLGLSDIAPTSASLLAWVDEEDNRIKLLNAPPQLVTLLFDDVFAATIPFAPMLLAALHTKDGRGADFVSLGLVASAVGSASGTEQKGAAKTNLKRYLGDTFIEEPGLRWGVAAEEVLDDRNANGLTSSTTLQRADAILVDIDGVGLVPDSAVLPSSYNAALATLGSELVASIGSLRTNGLVAALETVEAHILSDTYERRTNQSKMAVRLVRWLSTAEPDLGALAEAGINYRNDGGWVDYARRVLRNEADPEPDLAFAYQRVLEAVDLRRAEMDRAFANTLAAWDQGSSPSIIGIEHALEQVVAPATNVGPVLLLVMDGMGWDVWHELRSDLDKRGWYRIVDDAESVSRPCYAAFPTVTEVSRTSLLVGELVSGDQNTEKKRFPKHAAMVSVSQKSKPAAVFHKGELSRSDGGGIDESVSEAIADGGRKVVACVVNAIDDHLLKGDQVRPAWTIDTISPLGLLLEHASNAGRTIVITADHGHILDVDSEANVIRGAKERWRPAEGDRLDSEVTIEGSRTLAGGGRVYMPWVDQLRYSSGRRNGYHGGATPQEVLVPLDVLTVADPPNGWRAQSHAVPDWWTIGIDRVDHVASEPSTAVAADVAPAEDKNGQASLFGAAPTKTAPGWPSDLFGSDVFKIQYEHQTGRKIELERLEIILRALDANGNRLSHRELAIATGIPEARIKGALAAASRVLNIDGYAVLSDDGDVVVVDTSTARTQFGIG